MAECDRSVKAFRFRLVIRGYARAHSMVAAKRIAAAAFLPDSNTLTQLVKLALNNGVSFCAAASLACDRHTGREREGPRREGPPPACMHAAT